MPAAGGDSIITHHGATRGVTGSCHRLTLADDRASAELLPLVLEDALKVGFTRDARLIERVAGLIAGCLRPLPYGAWLPLFAGEAVPGSRVVIP